MIPEHRFVVADAVVDFFAGFTKGEREQLLRIFQELAVSPCQREVSGFKKPGPGVNCRSDDSAGGSSVIGSMNPFWRCV